jgi:hypothetical protein
MIKQYFFASYNIKNRFISHTSKGEFSVVFLKVLFQTEREMVKKIDLKVRLDGLMIKIPA